MGVLQHNHSLPVNEEHRALQGTGGGTHRSQDAHPAGTRSPPASAAPKGTDHQREPLNFWWEDEILMHAALPTHNQTLQPPSDHRVLLTSPRSWLGTTLGVFLAPRRWQKHHSLRNRAWPNCLGSDNSLFLPRALSQPPVKPTTSSQVKVWSGGSRALLTFSPPNSTCSILRSWELVSQLPLAPKNVFREPLARSC